MDHLKRVEFIQSVVDTLAGHGVRNKPMHDFLDLGRVEVLPPQWIH